MDASVTRISSNKQSLIQECAMKQGLKRVIKVTKFISLTLRESRGRFATLSDIQLEIFL